MGRRVSRGGKKGLREVRRGEGVRAGRKGNERDGKGRADSISWK